MHKVLVVDDDPKVCKLYEITLKKAGYDVKTAFSAIEGLKAALEEKPDVILSDFMMPDQDGQQFCEAVRDHFDIATTPFIVITGQGTPNLKTVGLSKLFDDYLEKPVDLSYLVAKINATIRRRREEHKNFQRRTSRFRTTISGLVVLILLASSIASGFKIKLNAKQREIKNLIVQKQKYDKRIWDLQNQLDSLGYGLDDLDFDRLNQELHQLIRKAKKIAKELPEEKERDIVVRGIKEVMAEFGAEDYVVPPVFAAEVARMINNFVGPQRNYMQQYIERSREHLPMIKKLFSEKGLPDGLAYIPIVESGFNPHAVNAKSGACGMWQLMPRTAREYGLCVNRYVDERKDPIKSTIVAREFLLDLIGIFGKDGFLLALASYNVGDGKVRYQLRKLYNPLEQRDFWYLFHKRALPKETREYIPKIVASIIIHRNAQEFGFNMNAG